MDFIVLITRVALRKDVCVIFAISISKSVSGTIFNKQLLYFIGKLVIVVILDLENVVFVSLSGVQMYCADGN